MNKHVGRVLVDLETTSKIVYRVRACKSYNRQRQPDGCWRVRTSMFDGV